MFLKTHQEFHFTFPRSNVKKKKKGKTLICLDSLNGVLLKLCRTGKGLAINFMNLSSPGIWVLIIFKNINFILIYSQVYSRVASTIQITVSF